MASFVSAAAAIRCATQIQRALAIVSAGAHRAFAQVRIGAAAGEPVEREHDLFGATVQLAARLCSHAQPEQILVSNVVAELCLGKGLPFKDLGDVSVKGFNRRSGFTLSNGPAQRKATGPLGEPRAAACGRWSLGSLSDWITRWFGCGLHRNKKTAGGRAQSNECMLSRIYRGLGGVWDG